MPWAPRRRPPWVLLLVALLAGCAGAPQTRELLTGPPAQLPVHSEIAATPFFPQETFQCGPAALAMVLTHAGAAVHPDALTPQVFIPGRAGSLQPELIAAARRQGQLPYVLAPRLSDLLAEVSAGHPVLVLQNLALDWYPRWHYAVVVGFDLSEQVVVLRSGRERRRVVAMDTFERTWARGGRWALVTLPPAQVPKTATAEAFLRSVAAFEQLGQVALARTAYRAAAARWPANATAWLALGNAEYGLRAFTAAEQAWRRALSLAPDYPPALNNLAQLLAEQGRAAEALPLAERAVVLDGGPVYLDTLNAVRRTARQPLPDS